MSTRPANDLTPEEYLELERASERKHEYYAGEMFALGGASRAHALIVTNLVGELRQQLRGRRCTVYATDLRLRAGKSGLFTYPDVMVVCGDEKFLDGHFDTLENPTVIIEVLSKSTKNYDRGQKFESYRMLASLREYLTVAQDKMLIEQWARQTQDRWLLTEHGRADALVTLESIGAQLRLAYVYENIELQGP